MLELNEALVEAMAGQKSPLHVLNPKTQEVYVLIRKEVYDLVCSLASVPNRNGWDDPEMDHYEQYRKKS